MYILDQNNLKILYLVFPFQVLSNATHTRIMQEQLWPVFQPGSALRNAYGGTAILERLSRILLTLESIPRLSLWSCSPPSLLPQKVIYRNTQLNNNWIYVAPNKHRCYESTELSYISVYVLFVYSGKTASCLQHRTDLNDFCIMKGNSLVRNCCITCLAGKECLRVLKSSNLVLNR